MSEEEIWECTPKKFYALLDCAFEYDEKMWGGSDETSTKSKKKDEVVEGFIDNVQW